MTVPPPEPENVLALMRDVLQEDPEANACIFLGQGDTVMVSPCLALPPGESMRALAEMVTAGVISRPQWAAICTDSYTMTEADPSVLDQIGPGDLGRMFEAGDKRVSEAILGLVVNSKGVATAQKQVYVRSVNPILGREYGAVTFVWGEIKDMSDGDSGQWLGGAVTRGLRALLGVETRN